MTFCIDKTRFYRKISVLHSLAPFQDRLNPVTLGRIIMRIKLIAICITLACVHVFAEGFSQKITLSEKSASLERVLNEIKKQSGVIFWYESHLLKSAGKINVRVKNATVREALDLVLKHQPLTYAIIDNTVVINEKRLPLADKPLMTIQSSVLPIQGTTAQEWLEAKDLSQKVDLPKPENITIRGKVTDEKGDGLPGVSILIKGTPQGTSSTGDGSFSIVVANEKAVLVFSFVGYLSEEALVGNRTTIEIALKADERALEEVVVVGYGTERKVNLTGAVSTVDSKAIENRPVTNSVAALQGAAPGLVITRSSGQPGMEGWGAQIRGATSINAEAGNSPLVIVDGVEGDLSLINPNDIANISVLKDAAAAAIYGAKAGGGVILVSTKKGSVQKVRVDYTGLFTINSPYNQPELLHSWEQAQMNNLAQFNVNGGRAYSPQQIGWLMDPDTNVVENGAGGYDFFFDNNLADILMRRTSPVQNQNVSISGGNERTQYLFSIGYFSQKGTFKIGPDATQRYNARLNLNTKLNNVFSIDTRLSYTQPRIQAPAMSISNDYGLMYQIYQIRTARNPIFLPGYEDRYAYVGTTSNAYPVLKDGGYDKSMQHSMEGVITFRADNLVKGLGLRLVYSPRFQQYNRDNFQRTIPRYTLNDPHTPVSGGSINPTNSLQKSRATQSWQNVQALADYDWQFGDNHSFHALGGFEYKEYSYNFISARQTALLSNNLPTLNYSILAATSPGNVTDNIQVNTWVSYFGRLTYNYASKYFLEVNVRNDATSRLAPGYQSAFFPSASAAWRLNTEPWFASALPFMDEFKLRWSWGQLGGAQSTNLNAYNYDYQALLNGGVYPFNDAATPYVYQNAIPSAGKGWEIIETINAGVDIGLFNNRLTGSFDYYVRNNNNVFIRLNLPATLGLTPNSTNAASLRVKGWETILSWRDKFRGGGYSVSLNVSDNQNTVTRYEGPVAYKEGLNPYLPGLPLSTIFGYVAEGYFSSAEEVKAHALQNTQTGAGDIKLKDINGDGRINAGLGRVDDHGDLVNLGDLNPRYTFGANLGTNWKDFDFSVLFQGVGKRKMMLMAQTLVPFYEGWRQPWAIHQDYWTPENTDARFPRPYVGAVWNANTSSHWVQNAAYIRLKNIQVGYTLPAALTQKLHIAKARIFLSGQDVWEKNKMWFKYFDAENPNNSGFQYPMFRSYSMGVNVSFQ